jgi:hypothetical protein
VIRGALQRPPLVVNRERTMDVYLNTKRDLLVVKKGYPMPPAAAQGKWRKSKKRVIKVSDEISSALQRQGYYMRKLRNLHSNRD